jgi:hypothetical protein
VFWRKHGLKLLHFLGKQKKVEVIKEISHLVGDPKQVDESSLKDDGVVIVRVLCKDVMKIEGSTLVFINGQGHMIKWVSEKLEEYRRNPCPNNVRFNR